MVPLKLVVLTPVHSVHFSIENISYTESFKSVDSAQP